MSKVLEWNCFAQRSGYAQAAMDYIYAIREANRHKICVRLFHEKPEALSLSSNRYNQYIQMIGDPRDDSAIQVYHCIPEMQRRFPQRRHNLGFATFETYDPPKHWIDILNKNTGIICPSKFNVQVFEKAGIKRPIFYLPHCIDTTKYYPKERESKEFVFLFVGTWRERKGYPQLIEAWADTFSASDNVRLVIKTDRLTISQQYVKQFLEQTGKKDIAPISWEGRVLNEDEMPDLFRSADCLVSPGLGEGFCIPALQSMACGVPVIITNYAGPTEFATDDTAILLQPNKSIILSRLDNIVQFNNRKWANITSKDVSKALRFAVENRSTIKEKSRNALQTVRERYTYNKVAKMVDDILEQIR